MAPSKVMLIRHAEKPCEACAVQGVDEAGRLDPNQLSVRGWQRAGALVRFFASASGSLPAGIETPSAIFACKPGHGSNSVRSLSTVTPLAVVLGLTVNNDLEKSDEAALIAAAGAASGAVLICWPHEPIPAIARSIAGDVPGLPVKWPGKRYDLVWVLDREGEGWRFSQLGQMLLPGDGPPAAPREVELSAASLQGGDKGPLRDPNPAEHERG
jgi:hypothetical protein